MAQRPGPTPTHQSPHRQHYRTSSSQQRIVKETANARSEYSNSEDDGSSQHRINQYWIRDEIGRGSFGAVHLAVDQYGQEYAVKEFSKSRLRRRAKSNLLRRPRHQAIQRRPGSMESPNRPSGIQRADSETASFELIKEEIAIMKKLHHPNLVALIEVLDDPEEDSLYMVLEMCKKGVVMKVEVDQDADPYTEEECRTWFRDLILAIEYLHAQGVVHRDIKPDNCLLTEDDTLKVVDFGVSEMFEKDMEMKIAKSAGSPAFMAPELCSVKHGDVFGKPADIWSMGVTLYCLRFGRVPFQQTAVLDLYQAICNDDVEIPSGCGPDFADLIVRLLEKDPQKRITMDELRNHPWVTQDDADPLVSAAENCSTLVSLPTEEEKNAAITGNMGRIMAVMKAVNKFKALIARRRPDLIEGMLGRASHFVQPPMSISKAKDDAKAFFGWGREAGDQLSNTTGMSDVSATNVDNETAVAGGDMANHDSSAQEETSKRHSRPAHRRGSNAGKPSAQSNVSTLGSATSHVSSPEGASKDECEHRGEKGHAHDPLEDHLFLRIGAGPSNDSDNDDGDGAIFAVSESPPAAEVDIFPKAYEAEVSRIQRAKGEDTILYSTRRIEAHEEGASEGGKQQPKKRLAGLLRKAVS